jgi:hypothetical protein
MESDNQKSAVSFMSRHFVALACEYETINRDGSIHGRGTAVYSGFLMQIYGRTFWVTAGHCLKDELDTNIDKGTLRVTGGGFLDYFGHEAAHRHIVPFTYEAHTGLYIEEPKNGLDFALLMLDELQEGNFAANKLVPITRENWIHQPRLTFDFYRMLGIPNSVFPDKTLEEVNILQAMIAVDRVTIDEVGEPPPDADVPPDAWFIGRLDPGAEIKDIRGMSGGPIYGFRRDDAGNLRYHAVALQSRWWDQSRTIFGCSIPYFAEAIHRQIDEFAQAYKEYEQMAQKNPNNIHAPQVINTATGKPMTTEEVLIADVQRREKQGKCVKKCGQHDQWCERGLGHNGFCMCEICKKED